MILQAPILAWLMFDSAGFFEWLTRRPWYAQILTDWVASIPVVAGERGLEVGCGPGLLTGHVHDCGLEVTGLDRSSAMVKRARAALPACTFIEGDALDLPLADDAMDVAFAASVVNVVSEPQKLLHEMTRVVRPGGAVSVLFPTPRLADDFAAIAKRRGLRGLSAGALAFWGSKAKKREPAAIEALFVEAGLQGVRVAHFFDDTVASVTGVSR